MEQTQIKTVLIAGAGTMGQQTALLCALNGYDTVMYDISDEILEKGMERIRKNASRMTGFNQCTREEADAARSRITPVSDLGSAARDADIVIESVPEDPALKGRLFHDINDACPAHTIFATNTSSLLPSMFAKESGRPEKLCALHFHDVAISKIVDVMPHPGTSPETVEIVRQFAEDLGQIPIVLTKENNGYVFNNMLMSFLGSALTLAAREVAPIEEIDRSWMGVMHTLVGPFGIMDSIGLDTTWKVTDYWARQRDDTQAKANAAFLKTYMDKGHLGIKTGQGFYTYPDPAFGKPDFMAPPKNR